MSGNLEGGLGLAMRAGKQNVHHAGTGAAGKKSFYGGSHDLGFCFPRLVCLHQGPETVDDDVHRVAYFRQFLLALDGARHIELKVELHQLKPALRQLAVIADRHDEIHAVNADPLPAALPGTIGNPLAGNFGPDVVLDPGFDLVADPAGFPGEDQGRFAFERQYNVNVTVNDFETGDIEHGPFEARVLVAADDQRVEACCPHGGADVFVTAIDFHLAWQSFLGPDFLLHAAQFGGGQCVNLRDVHQ